MSRGDTWMPLYIGDYLADTMHLNATEHGAYLLLLMHHWRNGPLPDDDKALAAIARTTPQMWSRIDTVVRFFFQKTAEGTLVQKRLMEERVRVDGIGSKRSEAGRKGAENRWKDDDHGGNGGGGPAGKSGSNGMANATDLPSTHGRQRPPQLQSQLEREESPGRDLPEAPRAPAPLPLEWLPSEADAAFAVAAGLPPRATADSFRDHFHGTGETRVNWSAVFRSWCRREPSFARSGHSGRVETVGAFFAKERALGRLDAADPGEVDEYGWPCARRLQ